MDENVLLLEVGSEAIADLTTVEKTAILASYTDAQVKYAALKVFQLLSRKFQPTFRIGRMYKAMSDKYEAYRLIADRYARDLAAGRLGKDVEDMEDYEGGAVDRYKFLKDTHV